MNSNVRNLFEKRGAPVDAGGEPPHDGGMDDLTDRVGRLESGVGAVREDAAAIKATLPSLATSADLYKAMGAQTWRMLGAFGAGFVILLAVMAHGFHWL